MQAWLRRGQFPGESGRELLDALSAQRSLLPGRVDQRLRPGDQDTVDVERALVADQAHAGGVLLAVDTHKRLGEEEMKVRLGDDGRVRAITKHMDAAAADGEYIGVARLDPEVADQLADALETTFRRDPGDYYEDGFQVLVDRGGPVHPVPIPPVAWVEVDDHDDLAAARRVADGW